MPRLLPELVGTAFYWTRNKSQYIVFQVSLCELGESVERQIFRSNLL
jgi:hypothetical protein